ncbi:MAG: ATP-binding protein [Bacteroidales bacterium]|nr:ATP-binding protein [Bacteroidales bacterium]
MEKLIIEKFAGIKSLEIDLTHINVLIGPQASGKSVSAKLIYFFKSFFLEIKKGVENEVTRREINAEHISKFINYFPKESWPDENFSIKYFIENSYFLIQSTNGKNIKFTYSTDIENIIKNAKNIFKKEKERIKNTKSIVSFELSRNFNQKFNELIKNEILDCSTYNQIFIPAGRSFFSNVQASIFSFLSSNKSIDPFLIEFGSFYENFKRFSNDEFFINEKQKKDKDFEKIINNILNSNYTREKEKDYLMHQDKRKVNLSNASSGQQEILPLLIILQTLTKISFSGDGAVLYIEEPEAHLSPNAQKMVVKLFARLFNSNKMKFQMIITTHSPYILSSFNNLMYAGYLSETNIENADIYKIIPQAEIIKPQEVSAYSFTPNKEILSLIDSETHLIAQNILDEVSNEISFEFGKLMELE